MAVTLRMFDFLGTFLRVGVLCVLHVHVCAGAIVRVCVCVCMCEYTGEGLLHAPHAWEAVAAQIRRVSFHHRVKYKAFQWNAQHGSHVLANPDRKRGPAEHHTKSV